MLTFVRYAFRTTLILTMFCVMLRGILLRGAVGCTWSTKLICCFAGGGFCFLNLKKSGKTSSSITSKAASL
uniref:Uncharacterized protein n=1 Tax=Anopheles darlingi TaxID=43151 RepID=A0A2M4DKL3_ANODA